MKSSKELKDKLITFFENGEQFIGFIIKIHSALSVNFDNFNRHFTSYSNQEFVLKYVGVRFSGARAMFDGEKDTYEISVADIISFEEKSKNHYIFIEKLSDKVYKLTELKFERK